MKCSNCQALNELTRPRCVSCGYWLVSATDLPVGSVLSERYQLLKPLGKGGMGMVFKAHDSVLEEDVALKLLRSDIAEEPDAARRFRQEIRLARKVRHRNVCAIHEYGEDGGVRYISMELIDGVDLRQVLRRQGPPAALEAVDISIQIAEGLDAIHEAGIIHRDLKTANIMIDAQGCVRLMDFGIAKQMGGEPTLGATALGTIMGTPEYMSPEQGRGEKTDFRTDVYSLGIMVFEIFTGQLPFKGDTPIATIFKHIQEPPPLTGQLAARIPGPVVPVLAKTLAKSAEDRYQSVRDMLKALRDVRAAFNVPQDATRVALRSVRFWWVPSHRNWNRCHTTRSPRLLCRLMRRRPCERWCRPQRPSRCRPSQLLRPSFGTASIQHWPRVLQLGAFVTWPKRAHRKKDGPRSRSGAPPCAPRASG